MSKEELDAEKKALRFRIDKGITLGELITIIVMIFGIGGAWADLRSHQDNQDEHLGRNDQAIQSQLIWNDKFQQSLANEKDARTADEKIYGQQMQEVFDRINLKP